jgi:hypothetical protein
MGRYLPTIIGTSTSAFGTSQSGKVHDGSAQGHSLLNLARTLLQRLGIQVPVRVMCPAWRPARPERRADSDKS